MIDTNVTLTEAQHLTLLDFVEAGFAAVEAGFAAVEAMQHKRGKKTAEDSRFALLAEQLAVALGAVEDEPGEAADDGPECAGCQTECEECPDLATRALKLAAQAKAEGLEDDEVEPLFPTDGEGSD